MVVGQTLGHYTILEKLGAGGMGEVYLAEDATLKRRVALKVLPPDLAASQERLDRFQREAETLAALDHPNIVTIHTVEEAEGVRFLTMQLVEGKRLSELIPKGGMPLERIFEIAIPLADALAAAHEKGVIHRDLKPGNIMFTAEGRVKVLDFGLAKLRPELDAGEATELATEPLTDEGRILGTVPYMSPEQLEGKRIDSRTDIFSLGVILYEMATGERPFRGDSSVSIISSIMKDTPSEVDTLRAELPHHLGRIIRHCLEKYPEQRFQTALDVRNEVVELRDEVQSGAAPSSLESRLPAKVRERRALWMSFALVAVLSTVVLGGLLFWRSRVNGPQDLRTLAVLPFVNLTGDPDNDHLGEVFGSGVMHGLSDLYGVQIAGRSEVASLIREQAGASEIGERLQVGSVVEGEILSEGERQRVVVSLTDTATGYILWSQPYTARPSEVPRLREDVVRDLKAFLTIPLTSKERRRLSEDPAVVSRAYAHYVRGQRFLSKPDDSNGPESAADNFRQAIRLHPELAIARAGLSEALWQMFYRDLDPQLLEQAEEQARLALEQEPDLPAARVALALVLRSTGQVAASIEALEETLGDHPNPDQAFREFADSYRRIGKLEEAESYLKTAVALNEADWRNWNRLGALLAELGRFAEARSAFQKAVSVAPDHIYQPLENLGTLHVYEADFEAAIETYEKIPEPIPSALLASNMATAYFFQGEMEKAVEYFALAVDMDPREAEFRRNYGDVLLRIGDPAAAKAEYRQAVALMDKRLEVDPGNVDLQRRRAMYSAKAGDCASALPEAIELTGSLTQTAFSAHDFAYIFALCGNRDQALEAIRQAIDLGISPKLMSQEDEFALLWDDPEFQVLTSGKGSKPK